MTAHQPAPGVIQADEAYTVDEFRRRAGLGDFTWRQVKKELLVIPLGRKKYVRGCDWLEYLDRLAVEQNERGKFSGQNSDRFG